MLNFAKMLKSIKMMLKYTKTLNEIDEKSIENRRVFFVAMATI